ncbi:Outer membrane component of tripartite multidrug resistance system [Acidisarcina polymorpha]|uniref:Outer membrane component of tripartite multidrug resistance system n=1 Tax=Acidisarcina polymorpha TaxID=2211140 RepID=A0A2Z5FZ11_9BACT|nr:TolC family protein [Acidisarcina polymorpha]AXC11645.1 Outer membrane component of tripartite multidrug resistance system [Acidisarcina polymorpha]
MKTGRPAAWRWLIALVFSAIVPVQGQPANQSSAANSYYGSVTAVAPTSSPIPLTLDDAIRLGLENNLGLTLSRDQQETASGQRLQALNALLPNLTLQGQTGVHQYNLAAEGFNLGLLTQIPNAAQFAGFPLITRVDVTQGQVNLNQTVFNLSTIEQYRAAKTGEAVAFYNMQSSRGLVVLNVATSYLQALSASAQLDYARALLTTDEVTLNQVVAEHEAGTVARLDELRARVQYQTQQQAVIAQENNFEIAKINLEREIGIPAGQKIQLTDTSPYAELEATTIENAKQEAYASRQDYQSMLQQIRQSQLSLGAAKHERLPSLNVSGFYGVQGISGSVYHGIFSAQGELDIPVFHEAKFRGDREAASARLNSLLSQMADLKSRIDQQLRDSLLDVNTQSVLVQVARSNLDLATTELDQTTQRFRAGIEDNLPLVEAQSTLADAQTQYVNTVYNYNQAKLGLARNLGIIDVQYQAYLKGSPPAGSKQGDVQNIKKATP